MKDMNLMEIKRRIYRRIGIRTTLLALWAAGLLIAALRGEAGEMYSTYLYMTFALLAIWVVYLIRDLRYLKNDDFLRKQAIERSDERTIFITYKATRVAAVILLCALPVAICILSSFGMQEAADTLAIVAAAFGVIYVVSWMYFSRAC